MKYLVRYEPSSDENLIKEVLRKEDLAKKIVGKSVNYNCPLRMEDWIYFILYIDNEPSGIVMLKHKYENVYNIHCGLYKQHYGKAESLGKFLLEMVLPHEFSGATLIAPTINKLSKRLVKLLGFKELEKDIYKYEVK